jgi:aryl-alcohol dehydrogenase (NADP+)
MEYRRLGASGLEVSALCLGTMMFGDRTDTGTAGEIVAAALDAGVNFIDTADAYAKGESERITGAAIAATRDRWILATKAGNVMRTHDRNSGGLSRRWLFKACEESLARLGTDWIDIYYLHYDDAVTPVEEFVGAVGDLIRAGKIRYFGVSNFRGWRIAEVMRWCERMAAGNLYVNRHTTGASVRRQPFGGWKGSSFGPGAKAGGPNYVLQLARWYQDRPPQSERADLPAESALLQR